MRPSIRIPGRLAPPLAVAIAAACAGPRAGAEPEPEPPVGWRVDVAEHLGLWYHGLAYVSGAADRPDTVVLPHFEPAYVDGIVQVKRRLGVYPTVLDRRAAELGRLLAAAAFEGMQFLPLYFRDADAIFSAIELWEEAGGDPRRAGSLEAARVIEFLSSLFPRAAQRRAVIEFAAALREERQTFYAAHWQDRLPGLRERVAAVQRDWDALAPALRDYLDYVQLENGELFLVPPLGAEGRVVVRGIRVPRAAVLEPPARRAGDAVLAFVHELTYPVVRDAVRDYVAPARIRELGEERLLSFAAVRAGAMLLEEIAPERADAYRRLYLRAAGRAPAAGADDLAAPFREAFPLPADLERGLHQAVRQALAGI